MPWEIFDRDYKAGQLILLSEGEYDRYQIHFAIRVTRDFSTVDALAPLLEKVATASARTYHIVPVSEIHDLLVPAYAEDLEYEEIAVGAGGADSIMPLICKHPNAPVSTVMGDKSTWLVCPGCNVKVG